MSISRFLGESFMLERIAHFFTRTKKQTTSIDTSLNVPVHVAVIMDGNGRWAKARSLPRIAGHSAGMKTVKEVVKAADAIGVKYLTMYAFSTENWKRPREEVEFLMKLPQEFLSTELDELVERNVCVKILGSQEELPSHTRQALEIAVEKTKGNDGLQLHFALNYGGRKEICDAMQELARQIEAGVLSSDELDEKIVEQHLYSAGMPDPDLLIRTSGEIRLSNFMLWQLAYTELWFTDVLWPDFTKEHFNEAIAEYQRRARRYGAV